MSLSEYDKLLNTHTGILELLRLAEEEIKQLKSRQSGVVDEPNCAAIRDAGNKLYNELRQWLATEHDSDSQDAMESWRAALTATAPNPAEQLNKAQGEVVQIEVVAVTREDEDGDLYLDWTVEGGISALEFAGQLLLVAHGDITGEDGSGEVYSALSSIPETGVVVERELLGWAVSKWHQEVANRPTQNIHRRSLDDTWRQVIRKLNGDPDVLCGPSHDAILSSKGGAE